MSIIPKLIYQHIGISMMLTARLSDFGLGGEGENQSLLKFIWNRKYVRLILS